jgi:hypothetical protein
MVRLLLTLLVFCGPGTISMRSQQLPDAPSALLEQGRGDDAQTGAPQTSGQEQPPAKKLPLCPPSDRKNSRADSGPDETCKAENPIQPIVTSGHTSPLSPKGKGELAIRSVGDPFNLITIGGYSAIAIALNSHSAYGPGLQGFGRLAGYSLVEDMQGEFFGTFLLPSLLHEDPRYHRMPDARVPKRLFHAIGHTFVSHHDDGTPMPNYATLLTYPISAELSNLYVPGVATSGAATARRVGIGIVTDPAGTIVAEFLPDIAKRIHIHVIFVQEILNRVIVGAPSVQ